MVRQKAKRFFKMAEDGFPHREIMICIFTISVTHLPVLKLFFLTFSFLRHSSTVFISRYLLQMHFSASNLKLTIAFLAQVF